MNDDTISREALRKDIEHLYSVYAENKDWFYTDVLAHIDNAPPASNWTPVTAGLPKEAFGCMVTVWDTDRRTQEDFETVLPYPVGYDGETWNDAEGDVIPFEVIAWQPWPSPYKVPEIDLGRGV